MFAIVAELVLCLAAGAAVAWFTTSATNSFLMVATAVACLLGFLIFVVRHGGWTMLLSLIPGP